MSLLDLVCPTRCSGCGAPGSMVCPRCRLCLSAPAVRHRPTPCPPGMPPTWVVADYDGPTRAMVLDLKERGVTGLARPLGEALARSVGAALGACREPVIVVPAPSAGAAVRRRGDDVVALLAQQAVRRLRADGRRVSVATALMQRRVVADSAGLSSQARAANLAGALAVRPARARAVRGAAVVVVDDLVTTGATLCEATEALALAGANVVGAASIAATRRRQNW